MLDGLELAAAFSLPPNQKGLCGPGKVDWQNKKALEGAMKKFRAPHAYLSLIADANGLEPFDYEVVESFWLGNKLLDRVKKEDLGEMIGRKFTGPDLLSPSRAQALATHLPIHVFPHHSFHVFYIGSVSGVLKRTSAQIDACRVSWGEVKEVGKKSVKVIYAPVKLDKKNKTADFSTQKITKWDYDKTRFSPEIGGRVASHWGVMAAQITARQAKNLEKYTLLNMALVSRRPQEG